MKIHKKAQQRGWWQFAVGMTLYVIVVVTTGFVSGRPGLPQVFKIVLAHCPMIPAVWAMLGWIRAVRGFDELILGEGLYWALGLTALLTFSYGFLEAYAEFPRLSMFVVGPLICVSFIFGQTLARRRYR